MEAFDTTKYQRLDHNERIREEHFIIGTMGNPIPVGPAWIGQISGDSGYTFVKLKERSEVNAKDDTATFATGSVRSNADGRGRFDLIPYEGILPLAQRFEEGAKRFGDRNWEKGQPLSRLLSSMRRHAMQVGTDFSENHIGAVLWNACAFATMVARIRAGVLPAELDDVGYLREGKK